MVLSHAFKHHELQTILVLVGNAVVIGLFGLFGHLGNLLSRLGFDGTTVIVLGGTLDCKASRRVDVVVVVVVGILGWLFW